MVVAAAAAGCVAAAEAVCLVIGEAGGSEGEGDGGVTEAVAAGATVPFSCDLVVSEDKVFAAIEQRFFSLTT